MAEMAKALLTDYTSELDEAWVEVGKVKDKYDAVMDDVQVKLFGEDQEAA